MFSAQPWGARAAAVRSPALFGAAIVLFSATLAGATPFFYCQSLPYAPGLEPSQGWGSETLGSIPQYNARIGIIHVGPVPTGCDPPPPPTQADLVAAINAANATATPTIVFPPNQTIWLTTPPPPLTASNAMILGNGATIRGDQMPIHAQSGAMLLIRGHDVIIRDLHFRNGGNDNLSIQGPAHHIVVSHISSTGAADDGLTISNRCSLPNGATSCDPMKAFDTEAPRDVTLQYSFFAGNTRSMFIKANNPATRVDRVSVHHNWFSKQWVRGPFVDKSRNVDYINNLVEDWAEWGVKFANGATGNVAYNLFRQSDYAVDLGQVVDPQCRVSRRECEFNGNPECPYDPLDPNENNQKKGFNLGTGMVPENIYTNDHVGHSNWYQGKALKHSDGTATEAFDAPPVFTLQLYGKLWDAIDARVGPCLLTPAQVQAWTRGEYVVCPKHPINQAYLDAAEWCVNEAAPFRPPG